MLQISKCSHLFLKMITNIENQRYIQRIFIHSTYMTQCKCIFVCLCIKHTNPINKAEKNNIDNCVGPAQLGTTHLRSNNNYWNKRKAFFAQNPTLFWTQGSTVKRGKIAHQNAPKETIACFQTVSWCACLSKTHTMYRFQSLELLSIFSVRYNSSCVRFLLPSTRVENPHLCAHAIDPPPFPHAHTRI